jgi:5-methylcytosine-specific restriction endonuclease McrA
MGEVSRLRATRFHWKKRWAKTRERVLAAHNGRCGLCDAPAEQVHHLIPRSVTGPGPNVNDPSRLLPVCGDFHQKLHDELDRSR